MEDQQSSAARPALAAPARYAELERMGMCWRGLSQTLLVVETQASGSHRNEAPQANVRPTGATSIAPNQSAAPPRALSVAFNLAVSAQQGWCRLRVGGREAAQ